jgi:hypothetical protein
MNKELYESVLAWEEEGRRDARDSYPYMSILLDIDFHATARFREYQQFTDQDGPFPARLIRWLDNAAGDPERKSLVKLLSQLSFVDSAQMKCLYRDGFRRLIVPWLLGDQSIEGLLKPNRPQQILEAMARTTIFSITDSMNVAAFCQSNNILSEKPIILGEDERVARTIVEQISPRKRLLILEDFVGSGRQARKILNVLRDCTSQDSDILFVPMIMLHSGVKGFADNHVDRVSIKPVQTIPLEDCITKEKRPGERDEHSAIRAVVNSTEVRVIASAGSIDDPPKNAFGYASSGAIIVTAHNVPNNTLPLIHHKNSAWQALFRRLHHPRSIHIEKGGKP